MMLGLVENSMPMDRQQVIILNFVVGCEKMEYLDEKLCVLYLKLLAL